jgi:zinc transporter ZupT
MIRHGAPFFWRLLLPFIGIGMSIYLADGQPWPKAFLNAAMLLGGMGPIGDMNKWWTMVLAGFYALASGLVFVLIAGVMLQPVMLEAVRRFHLEGKGDMR